MPKTLDPAYLTVNEVADMLRVSTQAVRATIRSGELPAVRIGRSVRIARTDLDAYLRRNVA